MWRLYTEFCLSFHNSLIFLSFWKYRGNKANLKLKYKWQNFVSYVTGIRIKPLSGWDLVMVTLPALACTQLIHIWISQSRQKILSNTYLCMCHHKSVYECIPIYVYTHIKAWKASIIWEGMGKHGRIRGREGRLGITQYFYIEFSKTEAINLAEHRLLSFQELRISLDSI